MGTPCAAAPTDVSMRRAPGGSRRDAEAGKSCGAWSFLQRSSRSGHRLAQWALFVDERLQTAIGSSRARTGCGPRPPAPARPNLPPVGVRLGWAAAHRLTPAPQVSVAGNPRRGVTIPAGPVEGGSSGVDLRRRLRVRGGLRPGSGGEPGGAAVHAANGGCCRKGCWSEQVSGAEQGAFGHFHQCQVHHDEGCDDG